MTSAEITSGTPAIYRPDAERALAGVPRFTIGTLVSDRTHYAAMLSSFRAGGFDDNACEYIYIDNTGDITGAGQTDAYRGLNALLNAARAPYVVLCHQDVRLLADDFGTLDQRLAELTQRDPNWAVAGNAGGVAPGQLAVCITDPHGKAQRAGTFPERVVSLDENFLVVRRDSRIGFSHDLSGFHFYGADICLHAQHMGLTAYVIDFHLKHLSPGKMSHDFTLGRDAFRAKWSRALAPRWLQTTCALVHLSGDPLRTSIGLVVDAPLALLARHLPKARGWKKQAPVSP